MDIISKKGEELRQRAITAAVIIALVLVVGLIDNIYLTGLVIGVIAFLGFLEAKELFGVNDDKIVYILLSSIFLSLVTTPLAAGVFAVIVTASYVAYYQKDVSLISPMLYPFLPLMALYALYLKTSMGHVGWLIVVVALTDTFAYFVGKNFGKKFFDRGFCPTSPNKSIEGIVGGVFIATVIGAFVGLYYTSFLHAFFISLVVSVSSVFGDLFESYLKRRAGVKDSGDLLPGHGGILDRIDGYLFAGPVMFVLF